MSGKKEIKNRETRKKLKDLRSQLIEQVKELDKKQEDALLIARWMKITDDDSQADEPIDKQISKDNVPESGCSKSNSGKRGPKPTYVDSRSGSEDDEMDSGARRELTEKGEDGNDDGDGDGDDDDDDDGDRDARWEEMKKRVKQVCGKRDGEENIPGRDVEKLIASVGDTCTFATSFLPQFL